MANHYLSAKWCEKKMGGGEEGLRTVECLRGRLLAERQASKAANQESHHLGNKLVELEKQLRMETRSRNRAEKRLNFLMKKLDSLNLSSSYISDGSEKGEICSSVSSSSSTPSSSSSIKSSETLQSQIQDSVPTETQTGTSSPSSCESHNCPSREPHSGSSDEGISGNSHQVAGDDFKGDEDNHGLQSSVAEKESSGENDRDWRGGSDNSLALVLVDSPMKEQPSDPPISDGKVKDVLVALRYARESLQSSILGRSHVIRVGSK